MTTGRARIGLILAGAALTMAGCGGAGEVESRSTAQAPSPSASTAVPAQTSDPATPVRPAPPPAVAAPSLPAAPAPKPPAPAPPAAPDYPTAGVSCEDGLEHVDELGALGADCDTARRVAAAVDTKILLLGEVPLEPFNAVDGWVCSKDRRQLEEYVYIACDKGDSRMESVTFGWGT